MALPRVFGRRPVQRRLSEHPASRALSPEVPPDRAERGTHRAALTAGRSELSAEGDQQQTADRESRHLQNCKWPFGLLDTALVG